MRVLPLPSLAVLNRLFELRDGTLVRKVAVGPMKAGSPAGGLNKRGLIKVRVNGILYYAHRLIYYIETGEQPKAVRHIDGDITNDSPKNLAPRQ